jgi:large subunit ribosomal protein L25
VPLHLTGEAAGVKDGGVLEQLLFNLPIEAMPQNIPHDLEADVSHLEIGDQLRLEEITLPPGVTTELEPDTLLVQVIAPRVAEEPETTELAEGEEAAAEGEEGEGAAAEGEGAPAEAGGDEGGEE